MPVLVGDLRQRVVDHRDVVGGVVRARVPRPQHPGQRLAGVVQPGQHRVIAQTRTCRSRRCPVLLRVAGHQGGVEVDHQTRLGPTPRTPPSGSGRPASARSSQARSRATARARFTASSVAGVDAVQHPPARRRRRHPPEQARLVPQPGEIGDRLPAVGQHHRHIDQHPTRRMRRPTHPATARGLVERLRPDPTPPPHRPAAEPRHATRHPARPPTPPPSGTTR